MFVRLLEDSKHPLLGPNLKALAFSGLRKNKNVFFNILFNIIYVSSVVFVVFMFIELYFARNNSNFLFMVSIVGLAVVAPYKMIFYTYNRAKWVDLTESISAEEICALIENDPKVIKLMRLYTDYSRIVTYSYCSLVFITAGLIFLEPIAKYVSSSEYRFLIINGTERYPQILNAWYPFNNTKMPGYAVGVMIQSVMIWLGASIVGAYDANAITIMTFLKGQLAILRYKCGGIFGEEESVTNRQALVNIMECHRLHNVCLQQFKLFNSLISPALFVYLLVCSVTIGCSVLQVTTHNSTISQKIYQLEYTIALGVQLFVYCWHSNALLYESSGVCQSVFASNWWHADPRLRKHLVLLAGKLSPPFELKAGSLIPISMPTFQGILKFTYSFYTILTNVREN